MRNLSVLKIIGVATLVFALVAFLSCTDNSGGETDILNKLNTDAPGDEIIVEPTLWTPNDDTEFWDPNINRFSSIGVRGFFLKDGQMVLYWSRIPEATGYIVFYGAGEYYTYSVETPDSVLFVSNIDYQQTWIVGVRAVKEAAVSDFIMGYTIQWQADAPQLQQFNPVVHAAQKAAWKALGITKYQFSAEYRGEPPFASIFTINVLPGTEPELIHWQYEPAPVKYQTIDKIFASIGRNYTPNGNPLVQSFIQYNETFHYPEYIGSSVLEPYTLGGSVSFFITDFQVLGK